MVIKEIKKLPPLERIKALKKLEEKTRKDLEELSKKTTDEIKESLDDIAREEEEKVKKEEIPEELMEKVIKPVHEKDLYEITNAEFYNTLKEARNKAAKGELSASEVQELHRVKTEFETVVENRAYEGDDPKHYAERSQELLNQIENYSSRLEEMSDYKINK